jgi:hypothetical protein
MLPAAQRLQIKIANGSSARHALFHSYDKGKLLLPDLAINLSPLKFLIFSFILTAI